MTAPAFTQTRIKPPLPRKEQLQQLAAALVRFAHDPLGFVMWRYPWGVEGSPLQDEDGPDEWQRERLDEIGRSLRKEPHRLIRHATASGNGIGKSAFVCWMIEWALMTKPFTRGTVTANTDTQLRTKTWAELAKWNGLGNTAHPLLADMFRYTATAIYSTFPGYEKRWRIDAVPWSKSNPAAFSGLHNAGSRVFIDFDEASEIEDIIWEMTDGACTDKDTEIIWLCQGNPTQNTGRFKEVVEGRLRHMWTSEQIDSRTAKRTNKALFQEWIDAFGIDSDFVRTHVTGKFPRLGSMQLISTEAVAAARIRKPSYISSDPLVAGLDVARYGDDASVLAPRRGRDAQSMPWSTWRGIDTMQLAAEAAAWCGRHGPDALFVDVGGMGVGVYDRLVQLNVQNVYPVNFGDAGREVDFNGVRVRCGNLRSAMWCSMREWLKLGAIPDLAAIEQDMTGTRYSFNGDNQIMLEAKQAMKARGLASPDHADALACTFAMPVLPKVMAGDVAEQLRRSIGLHVPEHDPLGALGGFQGHDPFRDL